MTLTEPTSLATLAVGETAQLLTLSLPDDERRWLEAVGLEAGAQITVLRRALFGGPLHLRINDDTELALAVALAERVQVTRGSAAHAEVSAPLHEGASR